MWWFRNIKSVIFADEPDWSYELNMMDTRQKHIFAVKITIGRIPLHMQIDGWTQCRNEVFTLVF